MGFKDLFLNSDENTTEKVKKVEVKEVKTKFPTTTESNSDLEDKTFGFGKTPSFTPSPVITSSQISPEHLQKAIAAYQAGFDSLNQNGYDFYEFYQAVTSAGADNPQVVQMAFTMAKSMDKSITKDKLLIVFLNQTEKQDAL